MTDTENEARDPPGKVEKSAAGRDVKGAKVSRKKAPAKKVAAKKPAPAKKRPAKKVAAKKPAPAKDQEKKTAPRKLYSIREIAQIFGKSESTIRDYIRDKDGPVVERTKQGKAASLDSVEWFEYFLALQRSDGNDELHAARLEKIQIDAASKRLDHRVRAGQVIEVEAVVEFFNGIMISIGTSLDGIAGRSAEGDSVLRASFLREVRDARTRVFKSISSYLDKIEGGIAPGFSATGTDGDGMGSRKKNSSKG